MKNDRSRQGGEGKDSFCSRGYVSVVGGTGKGSKREWKGEATFSKHELFRTTKCKVGMPLSEMKKIGAQLDWKAVLPALKVEREREITFIYTSGVWEVPGLAGRGCSLS